MKHEILAKLPIENFDELTFESSLPVLVFFGAERCPVCKELRPIVEEVILHYAGRMTSFWVDVDENKSLAVRFRLRGIPQLLMFNGGEIKDRAAGLVERDALIAKIENLLNI